MSSDGKEVNVLFTSVGRRVELLRSFRRAYQSLGLKGRIIALDIDPLAPALRIADQHYIVPCVSSKSYVATLIQICEQGHISLVFPLIDPDISVLAKYREEIQTTGARIAVVPENAAAIGGDKWRTYHFFKKIGLPTPRSWLPHQLSPGKLKYPVFVKPRRGSAAKGAFPVVNAEELGFFLKYVADSIIQEYLPGPEITTDVICDLEGDILAIVSRQRIEVRWGEVAKGMTIYDPAITEACIKIAKALPCIGPITVQCMMKEGVQYFTEINARLGGGAPLAIAAGVDFPQWLLARDAGIPVDIPPLGTYRRGLYMTRFDDSLFLTEDEREQMANHRL